MCIAIVRSRLRHTFFLLVAAAIICAPTRPSVADEEPIPAGAEVRRVWVLTDEGGVASEGGFSTSGPSGVIHYEITCVAAQLHSAQRKLTSAGIYGSPSWTVRIDTSLATPEGARKLQAALEDVCKSR